MRKLFSIAIALCVFPTLVSASEPNAGFVQGVWYAREPVFAETPNRIYVAVRNNTGHDMTGTIRFTDNGKRIGSFEVSALEGRLVEAWTDWTPTYGEHTITATVSDASIHAIGSDTETLDIVGITASDTRMVDYDTDADGTSNTEDADDDNDTVSDEDEYERGSDPLIPNPRETAVAETTPTSRQTASVAFAETRGASANGLERYVDHGPVDTFLTSVTEKIEYAGEAVDSYRDGRESQGAHSISSASSSPIAHMTVTRANGEKSVNLMQTFVSALSKLIGALVTYVLFVTSVILHHPALLETIGLLLILYLIFRIAKKFGSQRRH